MSLLPPLLLRAGIGCAPACEAAPPGLGPPSLLRDLPPPSLLALCPSSNCLLLALARTRWRRPRELWPWRAPPPSKVSHKRTRAPAAMRQLLQLYRRTETAGRAATT